MGAFMRLDVVLISSGVRSKDGQFLKKANIKYIFLLKTDFFNFENNRNSPI
jgi:hypothetical protein